MNLKIKRLTDTAKLPYKGSEHSAGVDLYSCDENEISVYPSQTVKISTGLAMEIPEGYFGAIFARSGLATKRNLRPSNCVGVIDSDYRGEVIVAIHNDSNVIQSIKPFERVAQLVILPYMDVDVTEVETLTETARGEGGFGSTGTN